MSLSLFPYSDEPSSGSLGDPMITKRQQTKLANNLESIVGDGSRNYITLN
jgi:hypothetical protein